MARDRKRAKQRRERRATIGDGASRTGGAAAERGGDGAPAEDSPAVEVPGALEHASADVDQFDAAVARGARAAGGAEAPASGGELEEDGADDLLQAPAAGAGGLRGDGGGQRPSGAPIRDGNRVTGFIRASWAELQRVQWPDRRQVTQATAVVLGFVALAGAYLGLADFIAKEFVETIL